jgi:hypothetical protein
MSKQRLFDDLSWPVRGSSHLGAQHLHERGSDYAACGIWVPKPGTPSEARPGQEWDGALCRRCVASFLKLERAGEPVERMLRPLAAMVRGENDRKLKERAAKASATKRERRFLEGLVKVRPSKRSRPSGLAERAALA